ncbi:hypothetical protein [Vulgatibacter incomptus]|uniref:hypothetical protein n=1 Tax=Vulgatibacter incomptus TaxID=1391653 RepID=UPI0012FCEE9B|nr:hypothetical protein [Vulgatibacter incomptus]
MQFRSIGGAMGVACLVLSFACGGTEAISNGLEPGGSGGDAGQGGTGGTGGDAGQGGSGGDVGQGGSGGDAGQGGSGGGAGQGGSGGDAVQGGSGGDAGQGGSGGDAGQGGTGGGAGQGGSGGDAGQGGIGGDAGQGGTGGDAGQGGTGGDAGQSGGTGGTGGAGACIPETDSGLCLIAEASCGPILVTDACGEQREVACGTCGAGERCGVVEGRKQCFVPPPPAWDHAFQWIVPDPGYCQKVAGDALGLWVTCGREIFEWDGDSTWTSLGWPGSSNSTVRAIWADGAGTLWLAVNNSYRTFRWDGVHWTQAGGTLSPVLNALGGSNGNVWLAGASGNLFGWSGSDWTKETLATTESFYGLWAAPSGEAWVVGNAGTIFAHGPSGWLSQASNTTAKLNAIHGSSATDVWAVGENGVAVHWDGSSWTHVPTGTTDTIGGVWVVSPNEAYILLITGKQLRRWNGTTWTAMPAAPNGTISLWGLESGELISVGVGVALYR